MPDALKRILDHWATAWVVLSLPGLGLSAAALTGSMDSHEQLHISGELSVRLLLLALWVTPLCLLFPTHRWPRWLLARRRWIGVASFVYGLQHAVFYVAEHGLLAKLTTPAIALGWVALAVFVPIAVTSIDPAVRALRQWWKPVQRLTYLAAALTVAHWLALGEGWGGVLVHFVPIGLAELWRVTRAR